jgi:hypothetical protein
MVLDTPAVPAILYQPLFGNTAGGVIRQASTLETASLTLYQRHCRNLFYSRETTSRRLMLIAILTAVTGDAWKNRTCLLRRVILRVNCFLSTNSQAPLGPATV